jgi:hypothetical protein
MTDTIVTDPKPEWFTCTMTTQPHERVWPFFEAEGGDFYCGLAHQDRRVFADALIAFWRATAEEDLEDPYDLVTQGWGIVTTDGENFYVHTYVLDAHGDETNEKVTAETPGAVAITWASF